MLYCVSAHTYPEPTVTFTKLVYRNAFYGCHKDELCTLKNKSFSLTSKKFFPIFGTWGIVCVHLVANRK